MQKISFTRKISFPSCLHYNGNRTIWRRKEGFFPAELFNARTLKKHIDKFLFMEYDNE